MATVEVNRELEPRFPAIGWEGRRLDEMLAESERLFTDTGHYGGLTQLELMSGDPIGYEKLFSRIRGGLVSARETALNISASPIVRELGELCFALYTPEGDSIALSTGIIVHVHTMSDAIKWMVRSGYEDNPGISPGDIFANNDPTIGDVHNADVQTFVPIFWEGELIAWAGGVTHVLDIGASTPGGVPVGPTMRYEDGIDLPCMKIGEHDELARWHLERCKKRTRASVYYLLDERTRLAGCHMVRESVERVLREEGVDRFKRFSREVIEEGRRSFKARIREMTVPGRYRSPAGFDAEFADKPQLPARARRDIIMHSPFEVRIGGDGTYELDYDGCSAWGWHSMNCTPSGMQGAIWVMFTQTLICNDKVNDGAYFAIETNFPEGTIANLGDAEGSTAIAWAFLQPSFTGFPRTISRALQARGFIEEVLAAYSVSGNVQQGGGIDQYGSSSAIMNFEVSAQGMGAKYVLDGTDYCAAMFNPEGDMGDVEMWELISPFLYLSRRVKASSGGAGRHRGGSSFESLFMVNKTPFWELQNIGTGRVLSSAGLFGGYPGATAYIHNIHGADLIERARRGEAYPIADGDFESPALMEIQGASRDYKNDGLTLLEPLRQRRSVSQRDEGRRRPRRPAAASAGGGPARRRGRTPAAALRRVDLRRLRPRGVPSPSPAAGGPGTRLGGDRARADPGPGLRRAGQGDVRGVDAPVAALGGGVPRLLGPAGGLRVRRRHADRRGAALAARQAAPRRGGRRLPRRIGPAVERGRPRGHERRQARRRDARGAAGGEALAARGQGDPVRLQGLRPLREVGRACSRRASATRTRSCLPAGEGLNIVRRRSDGQLVYRCDCGHDFCAHNRNWKMDAVVHVRDSEQALLEVYPKMAGPDPALQQIREYYCPTCARQLEVEALQPGYPVVHEFLPDVEGFYRGWLRRELPS